MIMKLKYTGHYNVHGLAKDKTKDLSAEEVVAHHVSDRASGYRDVHDELKARCDALEALIG